MWISANQYNEDYIPGPTERAASQSAGKPVSTCFIVYWRAI
jgi:hypothetical protein